MLRFLSSDIVFQEVPGEVTLAINLSNCPNRCKGCHSPMLQEDRGGILDEMSIGKLLSKYGAAITCVCFMGGDVDPLAVQSLSIYIKTISGYRLKTAWYSGQKELPDYCAIDNFDFIKLGSYVEKLGGLDSPTTNQRFYRVEDGVLIDETQYFRKVGATGRMLGVDSK